MPQVIRVRQGQVGGRLPGQGFILLFGIVRIGGIRRAAVEGPGRRLTRQAPEEQGRIQPIELRQEGFKILRVFDPWYRGRFCVSLIRPLSQNCSCPAFTKGRDNGKNMRETVTQNMDTAGLPDGAAVSWEISGTVLSEKSRGFET